MATKFRTTLQHIYEKSANIIMNIGNYTNLDVINEMADVSMKFDEIKRYPRVNELAVHCINYLNKDFGGDITFDEYINIGDEVIEEISGTLGEFLDDKDKDKVYVVYNESLYHDSSYHRILDVYRDINDALVRVGCEYSNFCDAIKAGVFGNDFDEIETDEDLFPINPSCWDEYVVSTLGFYEAWRVEEYGVI